MDNIFASVRNRALKRVEELKKEHRAKNEKIPLSSGHYEWKTTNPKQRLHGLTVNIKDNVATIGYQLIYTDPETGNVLNDYGVWYNSLKEEYKTKKKKKLTQTDLKKEMEGLNFTYSPAVEAYVTETFEQGRPSKKHVDKRELPEYIKDLGGN